MAEIVNLRQARKLKARQHKEQAARENRLLHGRTKAERTLERKLAQKAENLVENHRLGPGSDDNR